MMKRLIVLLFLCVIISVAHGANQAVFSGIGHQFEMNSAPTTIGEISLTTFDDNRTAPPLGANSGLENGEVKKINGIYRTDYMIFDPILEDWGTVELTFSTTDNNGNGVDDFLEISNVVNNLSLSGTWFDKDNSSGPITGFFNRSSGNSQGSYNLTIKNTDIGDVNMSSSFVVGALSGTATYDPENFTIDFSITVNDDEPQTFIGNSSYTIVDSNTVTVAAMTLSVAPGFNISIPMVTYIRDGNDYTAMVELQDGDPETSWVDYEDWTFTITDPTDSNSNEIPDFSDIQEPTSISANFQATPTSGPAPLTVQFTDTSTAINTTISSWVWDFDSNGSTDSTEQNPQHMYTEAGTFSVSLSVSDGEISDTKSEQNFITVLIIVPDVEGQSQTQGIQTLMNVGLLAGAITTQNSSTVPLGDIISQSPAAGTHAQSGMQIDLVVSAGLPSTTVPDVIGATQSAAESTITDANLVVGVITMVSSTTIAAGSVISQDPQADLQVVEGSRVNLIISSGPPVVSVPNVVNLTQNEAEANIESAGLLLGTVSSENSTTVVQGSVIEQFPTAGTQVVEGSAVNLVVSLGPATVMVPNIVNQPFADARIAILEADLLIGDVTSEQSDTVAPGSVIISDPIANTELDKGSIVNIVVSSSMILALNSGWNLISIDAGIPTVSPALIFGTQIVSPIWSWEEDKFVPANEILATKGYWVHSFVQQKIAIPIP